MSMIKSRLMKTKWFPRPHQMALAWGFGLEKSTKASTIVPIAHYDEGLGAPSAYNANPEHASFTETADTNCFVGSRVDRILGSLEITMTKLAIETDKLQGIKIAVMPIFVAFKEDYIAIDEKSTLEIQDILELQTEATDRQGGPLYTSVDMDVKNTGSSTLGANAPFLTADTKLEAVTFVGNSYYDMLHYGTISGKLKSVQGGLKWMTLSQRFPKIVFKVKLRPKVKAMNPFTFFGLLIHCPISGFFDQIPIATDTTDIIHVMCSWHSRLNEWNQGFDHEKV